LPLDRTVERDNYRAAIIAFENARRGYDRTYDQVQVDVRSSIRDLNKDRVTIDIQRRAIDLAQLRVEYAVELLTQGKAVSRDVTDPQADLLAAQTSFNQAKASLQIAILNFLNVTGTLRLNPDAGSLATAMDSTPSGESGVDPELRKLRS
jgi:outer membrane protein TolC